MRALLLLAVVLVLPAALAQSGPLVLVELDFAHFDGVVQPLQGPVQADAVARVSCALVNEAGRVPVRYEVSTKPEWATVVVSPVQDVVTVQQCEDGYALLQARLTATADDKAPAFSPEPVRLKIIAGSGERTEEAVAQANLTAGYFSILDVQLKEAIVTVAPGEAARFEVELTNHGNGATGVDFQLTKAAETLDVTLPPPLVLGSRQGGADDFASTATVTAKAPPSDGLVNRVETFSLRIVSAYEKDDSFAGDESSVSFLVTVKSQQLQDGGRLTPSPSLAAALALLSLLAMLRPFRP